MRSLFRIHLAAAILMATSFTHAQTTLLEFTADDFLIPNPGEFTFDFGNFTGNVELFEQGFLIISEGPDTFGGVWLGGFEPIDIEDNSQVVLELDFLLGEFNEASIIVASLDDMDDSGVESQQFTVPIDGGSTTEFTTVSVPLSDPPLFIFMEQDGVANFGLTQIILQSEFGVGTPLEIEIAAFRIVELDAPAFDPLDCNTDGAVDGGDVACATADTLGATLDEAGLLAGDLNLDGDVGFPDFLILSDNFGDEAAGGVYANGDIDLDGAIGFPDFLVLSNNFGESAAGVAAVPEPSGLLSCSILAVGLLVLRRRSHRTAA